MPYILGMGVPWYHKLWMIAAFVVIMLGVWWVAHSLVYDWLPPAIVNYLAVGIVCLAGGFLIGERSARRERERGRSLTSRPD